MKLSMTREQFPPMVGDVQRLREFVFEKRYEGMSAKDRVVWAWRLGMIDRLIDQLRKVTDDEFLWNTVIEAEARAVVGDGPHGLHGDSPDDGSLVQQKAS